MPADRLWKAFIIPQNFLNVPCTRSSPLFVLAYRDFNRDIRPRWTTGSTFTYIRVQTPPSSLCISVVEDVRFHRGDL
ncbi:MAG: hypothetical protein FRX48_07552 [Lasallia pustulata]|uniref:Uncharacterized protein n=1 Tax=Lasallia pustulata TaxID=136370 RepID=A0A5M8PHS1_9LECA|nr:MAG: hypothetical protein FRX48_07552 [Lasallia pustulata]